VNNILKLNSVHRQFRLKVYNMLAIPSLLYGCEIWTLKGYKKTKACRDEIRETRSRLRFTRPQKKKVLEVFKYTQYKKWPQSKQKVLKSCQQRGRRTQNILIIDLMEDEELGER